MLPTLTTIGLQLLEGKGIWARLTTEPKIDKNKTPWVCPILFDCVNKEIKIHEEGIERFKKDESAITYRYLDPENWGRRGIKCALAVEPKNFSMLEESLFGKTDDDEGSMMKAMEAYDPNLTEKPLHHALKEINENLDDIRDHLDYKKVKEELPLGKQDEAVLFYSVIKSEQINEGSPTKLFELEGYEEFVVEKFGTTQNPEAGLDYVTGNYSEETIEAVFSGRYNLNKVFQTTTTNYANQFSNFRKNFQVSPDIVSALDRASEYVLDDLQVKIAGINHVLVPDFLTKNLHEFDLEETEVFLNRSSEFLFRLHDFESEIERELPDVNIFWINYLAFESDGNSLKVINHIKDVNSRYLTGLADVFHDTAITFRPYIGGKYLFNLQSIYYLIPVRDGQIAKKNEALDLFKDILEQRTIDPAILYRHFINLLLCHWYRRYQGYPNIPKTEHFDFAVKDAVFKYSALFFTLNKLGLIIMEQEQHSTADISNKGMSEFQQQIQRFFEKMEYTEAEEALFYLGRILSAVAYAQYKKGHESKPILNKVNFNGMDAQAVMRLSLDLAEKTRQYGIHSKTEWNFSRFHERFTEKSWPLGTEQNVFYLMAGYAFGLTQSESDNT